MSELDEIMQSTVANFERVLNANNVIGTPFVTESGAVVMPVSKISFGFFSGRGEYSESKPKVKFSCDYPAAGGGGGGVTITPVGFFVQEAGGSKFLRVDGDKDNKKDKEETDKWIGLAKSILNTMKKS